MYTALDHTTSILFSIDLITILYVYSTGSYSILFSIDLITILYVYSTGSYSILFSINLITILHSRSVDPQKLHVGVKYYIVHMYSMPYYTYGSTANILSLRRIVLMYISKEWHCNEDLRGVGNFLN